jgi:hypothetical protein
MAAKALSIAGIDDFTRRPGVAFDLSNTAKDE